MLRGRMLITTKIGSNPYKYMHNFAQGKKLTVPATKQTAFYADL